MEDGADSGLDMRDINISGPAVLAALTQACSQDASVLKPAEQQLHNWETQPGFYTVLHVDIDHQFNYMFYVHVLVLTRCKTMSRFFWWTMRN